MKQRSVLVLSAVALLLASCSNKGGKSGLMVPKDAAFVLHINSASLSSKISWNEIKQTSWFTEMRTQTASSDSLAQKLFDDPSNSGVDTKKDFVMYVRKQGRGSYVVLEGSLTSESAYEQVLAEMTKKEPKEIKKSGEFSYMVPHDKTVVLWNKSKFAFVSNSSFPGNMPSGPGGFMKNRQMPEHSEFEADSLRIFAEQALTLEGGNNLDADSRFSDLVKNGSDIHLWINLEYFYSGNNPLTQQLPTVKTEELFKGNISAVSLNFDNGKITARSQHYYSEALSKIMANNKPQPISAAVINRIPSSNVAAVFAFNYSPQGLKETLNLLGLDAVADIFLGRIGFSIDEFVKANKGEVLVAIADLNAAGRMDTTEHKHGMGMFPFPKSGVNILFATSANDTASFQKMIGLLGNLAKNFMGEKRMGMDSTPGSAPAIPGINYKLQNNWFAISNSDQFRDKFLAGGNSNLPFVDKITGHPIGFYIDLQKIVQWFHSSMDHGDSSGTANLNIWQDIVAKGGDYKDKTSEFEVEVNFVDKNTNSLKQLNQFIDKMATIKKERKENRDKAALDK